MIPTPMNDEISEGEPMTPPPSALPPRPAPAQAHPLISGANQTQMPTRIKVSINRGPASLLPDSRRRRAPRCNQPSVHGVDPHVGPPGTNGMIDDGSYGDQRLEYLFRTRTKSLPFSSIRVPLGPKHRYRRQGPDRTAFGLCNGPHPHHQLSTPDRCRCLQSKQIGADSACAQRVCQ